MVLEVPLLLLVSPCSDWVPVRCRCSSGMSPSLWVTSLLELVPVPVSENISLWEGVLVWEVTIFSVIVLFISLWEGVSVLEWAMLLVVVSSLLWAWNWPNGTVGRVSSDWWLSLGLTTDRSPLRSWIKSLSALACDNSVGISKSGSSALMVHLGGCDLVLLAGMVLTLLTGSPANLVCFFGLMALYSGYSVSAI